MSDPYTLDDADVAALEDIATLAEYILTYPKGRQVQPNAQAIAAKIRTLEVKMGCQLHGLRINPWQQDGW
jgi:hypothetical protein